MPRMQDASQTLLSTAEHRSASVEATLERLAATPAGLSETEARRRMETFGRNEIATKKKNLLVEFLSRFWGPMPWLLELAIVLSFVLKHYLEAVIIAVLIILNAVIGYLHHRSSQRSLELLKKRLALNATVLRDGQWVRRAAAEIVPGDVVVVQMGEIVPADAKVIDGELSVDQSALTGESLPIEARESDVVYSSSIVKRGEARCLIVNTGKNTYFGKTVELVRIARPKSHQEQIMVSIVRYMMYLGLAALTLVAADALWLRTGLLTIATFAVIFLMGAVPVALPAVLTIVQAVGARTLVAKGALVTRLDSIEDAASIEVLCLDKTGTLTMNQLAVREVVPYAGGDGNEVIRLAALAAGPDSQDLLDATIREHARSLGLDGGSLRQVSTKPFEPATKRSEAIIQDGDHRFRVVKGAPQIVAALSQETPPATLQAANEAVEAFSRKGYRTLAVGRSTGEDFDRLQLLGLLALEDPPRPDARSMIAEVKALGIKPMMVTGDHAAIAREITRELGMDGKVLRMSELKGMSESDQLAALGDCDGLAEVYPEDKYHIVKLLQSRGHMVGMTGDGVNDAPALKQAEIGIAVSGATDVARSAASIVLTEKGIRVIVDALKTSRQTYQRMLTWVINKVSKTIQIVGLLTLGFFWLHELVISMLGMALLVLANDFVTMALSTDNVKYTSNPNKWNVRNVTLASAVIGALFIVEGWIALLIGRNFFHLDRGQLLSFTLLMLIFTSQFRIYIVRERRHLWDSSPSRSLVLSSAATVVVFGLLAFWGVLIPSIAPAAILFVLGYSALFTLAVELPKYLAFKRFGL
jgi:H+-transporting ATPase